MPSYINANAHTVEHSVLINLNTNKHSNHETEEPSLVWLMLSDLGWVTHIIPSEPAVVSS